MAGTSFPASWPVRRTNQQPADGRWFVSATEQPPYSQRPRHSLAETLALLTADGDAIAGGQMDSPRARSEQATARVLEAARGD